MNKKLKLHTLLLVVPIIAVFITNSQGQDHPSLATSPYSEIPLGEVKPRGWLLHQLEIMRDGTTGHLDEVHNKIKNDNGWLGGEGDGWEETPYWLDGAVPLAFLLDDPVLKAKVMQYINWTLDHQRASGYFGPITKAERENGVEITSENCEAGEDWWPKMVMLKVLQQYYLATQDKRVLPFMTNYFNYQLKTIKTCTIGKWTEWAKSRGIENVMMAQWLYQITGDASLLELAEIMEGQSFQWSEWLGNRDWVMQAAANQTGERWMERHAVNVAMALKAPAINYQRTKDEKYLESIKTGWNDLMTLHGLPMGIFSGDEDLHGNDPSQGVELCAIVESMFSLEKTIAISGDVQYMDALERMTFNALPTQTTDDYNMKQYFQVANQVQVSRGVFDFSLPFDREMNNVFGLKSGYTCCTSNMHQGWTKFTEHLWYATPDGGLAALIFSPNQLKTKIGNEEVVINEVTNYPFEEDIVFEFELKNKVKFPMQLRIPSWCKKAIVTLNGKELRQETGGQVLTIDRTWENKDKLKLHLPMEAFTSNWAKNSRTVERGPLVYALKLGEKWEKANQEVEGEYYSIFPTEDWNFGLLEKVVKEPGVNLNVSTKPVAKDFIWNQEKAPIEIKASAKKIPGWVAENGVAHQPVTARDNIFKGKVEEKIEEITLIPYGCTKVRIVAFPVVR
ncbi:beta-L-arabinofuranosidase domain-containing protein [Flexithrix dorotheae]|uniref:beta-L-arabinofuranosidase domain-containing protein n=1 Tax=Flexithrix dorotheae TaxID=70993 RepID=UPI0003A3D29E|nr:beta-L-arabinofuranosidase domain-containing protein [Flexithrix dorotheae]